jgi:hypothetical protein
MTKTRKKLSKKVKKNTRRLSPARIRQERQICSRGKYDNFINPDQLYDKDDCVILSGDLKEGGQSVNKMNMDNGYVLRQTVNDEWDTYRSVQQLVERCINPHFVKMYRQRKCKNERKNKRIGYEYHQVLELFDGDLKSINTNNTNIKIQLYTTIYSLVNNNMILIDRKPENIFYSVGDYSINYKLDGVQYTYLTDMFIVHGDYMIRNDCEDCKESTLIQSVPYLQKSVNSIFNLCYDVYSAVDMENGINRFLEESGSELSISEVTIKRLLTLLKKALKKLLKSYIYNQDDRVYWEIDKKI